MGFDLERGFQILNDVTGKLDARKACKEALKIHKKYLLKVHIYNLYLCGSFFM